MLLVSQFLLSHENDIFLAHICSLTVTLYYPVLRSLQA